MFKILFTLLMLWLLVRLFRQPSRSNQSKHTSPGRTATHTPQQEGTTTLTRIGEPKKKVIDSSDAETAHYEEVE